MVELDDREIVALTAAAIGLTQVAAARRLGIHVRRLRDVQDSAIRRLGAAGLAHAIALASAGGLVDVGHLQRRSLPPSAWPPAQPRRTLSSLEHLKQVSTLYGEAVAAGEPPRNVIAAHFGVSPLTASQWAQQARRVGVLTVTCPPGRPRKRVTA